MFVLMHGPAFTEEGEIVERQVPDSDVPAYQRDGWIKGPKPEGAEARPRDPRLFGAEEESASESKESKTVKTKGK